jgi:hypothetical protein
MLSGKKIFRLIYFIGVIVLFSSCGQSEEEKLKEKYKCSSCEDCLTKYEFEGARAYLALADWREANFREEIAVLTAEANYWVKEKDYERAIDIVEEFHLDGFEEEKQKVKFNVLSSIIDDYIYLKDFDNAKIYALKSSDDINLSGESKSEDPSAWDEESEIERWRSQQTELIERIQKAEKLLNK